MADVLLFHHAQGLTPGVQTFAEALRAAGHTVHVPDLYDGRTFTDLDEGVAHAENEIGFDKVVERGLLAAEGLPAELVYAGFSLGVMPAQKLAQTRPGAKGAVLIHSSVPTEYFGAWPDGLRAQIHTMEDDDWGDVDVARALALEVDTVELFLYPGDRHLFTDSSLPAYDETTAALVEQRMLSFLDTVG